MRRVFLVVAAFVLAITATAQAAPIGAVVPDVAKWQQCYHETMPSGKVRYTIPHPKASFEVEEVRFDGKAARVNAAGTFYRVMDSQELAGKHYVYTDFFGEAQGFSTWVRCKKLYP